MGLMDFFKKGREEPIAKPSVQKDVASTIASPSVRTHTVKSGESLSLIAKKYYGDASKWHAIYDANKDKIKNPDVIQPNQTFTIPNL